MNNEIDNLIEVFASLPTIGRKTATRIVLDIISNKKDLIPSFIDRFHQVKENIKHCGICHNIDVCDPCNICVSEKRDKNSICVVENIEDLWAIENSNIYRGTYHVLGGVLSAVKGIGPDDLKINSLERRLENIDELIIGLSASLDGQTTNIFLSDLFSDKVKTISKLGYGIPLGSEIGYLDEGTLNAAFQARKVI